MQGIRNLLQVGSVFVKESDYFIHTRYGSVIARRLGNCTAAVVLAYFHHFGGFGLRHIGHNATGGKFALNVHNALVQIGIRNFRKEHIRPAVVNLRLHREFPRFVALIHQSVQMFLVFTRIKIADTISQGQKGIFIAGNVEDVIAVFARFKQECAVLGRFNIGGNRFGIPFLRRGENRRIAKVVLFFQIHYGLASLRRRLYGRLQFFV